MKTHWTSIHWLRALAAGAVVAHHVPLYLEGRVGFAPGRFEHGAVGVDVFFIVSGFVMQSTTSHRDTPWYEFLAKRSIRVLPMYWLLTLALAAAVWLVPLAFSTFRVSVPHLVKSLAFLPVYTHEGLIRPVLAAGWTLYFELLFYALVAAWLVVCDRAACLAAAATMVALALLGYVFDLPQPYTAMQLLSPIVFEFAVGVVLARIFEITDVAATPLRVRALLAVCATLLGLFLISRHTSNDELGFARVACWGGGACMCIVALLWLEPELSRARAMRAVLDPLGAASYALYLVHGVAFSVSWKLGPRAWKAAPLAAWLLLLAGPIAAALLLNVAIEAPLTKALNTRLRRTLARGARSTPERLDAVSRVLLEDVQREKT